VRKQRSLSDGAEKMVGVRGPCRSGCGKMNGCDQQAWLTEVLSRIAARLGAASTAFRVERLIELIKIHRESTPPDRAEINDERRPAAAYPGRLLRTWMKFVDKA
jgi:hypothetical protein